VKHDPLDGLPAETRKAIREYVARVVAEAPPLTDEQVRFLRALFGPRRRNEDVA
jgi:hypothetical protein